MSKRVLLHHIRLEYEADLEEFANAIREAVIDRIRLVEKFSAIRLEGVRLRYNDFLRERFLGLSHSNGVIEVRQGTTVLDLAETVIHEMAHQLVGNAQDHNENWRDAGNALGLLRPRAIHSETTEDAFDAHMLTAIERALAEFLREHPTLAYDPEAPIPFPSIVGFPDCPDAEHEDCTYGHEIHLLPFQVEGIREMLRRPGNILLGDEMGLGKTIQAVGVINVLHPKRLFIGCPNNAKLIWKRHLEKYCVHADILENMEVAYTQLYAFSDVVIMNYEAMVKWESALTMNSWDMVIYDEGHYLKTPSAKRSRAAYKLKAAKSMIVTGTPIVNYPFEVFPLLHYLDRRNWPEYGRFERDYGSRTTERLGRNLNRLNALLRATIMTRRFKKDVMPQLPKKRRQVIEVVPSPEIRKLIQSELELFNKSQNETEIANWLNAMRNESDVATDDVDWARVIEALQSTKKFLFHEMARIAHSIGQAKVSYAIEHIENLLENREKVIIFGHHRDVLTAIYNHFKDEGNGAVLLLGGHSNQAEVTQIACDRFNEDDRCTVFVAQVSNAQGYSIKSSSTVVFVEEDWVPGIMTQAEDRAHGLGRGDTDAKSMLVHHLVFEDSLDTKKAQLTIRKQKSIDRATGKS